MRRENRCFLFTKESCVVDWPGAIPFWSGHPLLRYPRGQEDTRKDICSPSETLDSDLVTPPRVLSILSAKTAGQEFVAERERRRRAGEPDHGFSRSMMAALGGGAKRFRENPGGPGFSRSTYARWYCGGRGNSAPSFFAAANGQ